MPTACVSVHHRPSGGSGRRCKYIENLNNASRYAASGDDPINNKAQPAPSNTALQVCITFGCASANLTEPQAGEDSGDFSVGLSPSFGSLGLSFYQA